MNNNENNNHMNTNYSEPPLNSNMYYNNQYTGNPYSNNPQTAPLVNSYEPKPDENNIDIESGTHPPIREIMRLGFIRKVYGILSLQLTLTIGMMSLSFIPSVGNFLLTHMAIFWVAFALSLTILIPLVCFRKLARSVPQNYILLSLWTLCESYMLATACATYPPSVVLTAGVMTAAVTIALTFYAMYTKTDFTFCGAFLFVAVSLMFFWGLFALIFSNEILNTVYCVCGVLVYSIYLIFDTQLIMGKFGLEYQIDDYIFAALSIYLDIIQIFLYLLQILGGRR